MSKVFSQVKKICLTCKEEFMVHNYRKDTAKFCSTECHSFSLKGKINIALQGGRAFSKGNKHPLFGKHLTKSWREKISKNHADLSGEKNIAWKGEHASYGTKHDWVERQLGKPQRCDKCGSNKKQRYEWANRSRLYKRELSDWTRLCVFCHRKADYHQLPL